MIQSAQRLLRPPSDCCPCLPLWTAQAELVEDEFLRGTSVARKKIDQVFAAVGRRLKEILMEKIAIEVQRMRCGP